MELSAGEVDALRHLLARQDDQALEFISIADARALTTYGLASRTRQGWAITEAGRALLLEQEPQAAQVSTVSDMTGAPHDVG